MRDSLRGLWSEAWDRFELAERGSPDAQVMDTRIAGTRVRIRFANTALRHAIGRALEHLRMPLAMDPPDLTIGVWDSVSAGVPMPRPPWPLDCLTARGDIAGFGSPQCRVSFHVPSGMLSMLEPDTGRGMLWIRDAAAIPRYVRSMPMLPILHWWTGGHGMQLVHAGAVGDASGGALLAGAGGSGKSCTALACALAGMSYVSDDYCVIGSGPSPRAHSVFSTGRLHASDVARLQPPDAWMRCSDSRPDDKTILFLGDCASGLVTPELPITVILLPRSGRWRETCCEPASPSAAMRSLMDVTMSQLPHAGQHAVGLIASLVRSVPCRYLNLGADGRPVADVVREQIRDCR
ncbi:MAG: hypothetical protein FGM37_03485 [Phycisphaerales bacterium]|nr:hypothetical protein [Phycisphaerales bacterium]